MTNIADLMIERSAMVLAHICTMAYGSKPRWADLELIRENAHAVVQFVPAEEFFRKVIEKGATVHDEKLGHWIRYHA
jgi:hypothetical protein